MHSKAKGALKRRGHPAQARLVNTTLKVSLTCFYSESVRLRMTWDDIDDTLSIGGYVNVVAGLACEYHIR